MAFCASLYRREKQSGGMAHWSGMLAVIAEDQGFILSIHVRQLTNTPAPEHPTPFSVAIYLLIHSGTIVHAPVHTHTHARTHTNKIKINL